jgi:hypothetical protein
VALPELVSEARQTLLDRAIQVADGREVLQLGNDVTLGHQRHRLAHRRVDALRAFELHALRALEEHEVLQGPLAEGHQRQVHARGIVVRRRGQVRPRQMRRRADRGDRRPAA